MSDKKFKNISLEYILILVITSMICGISLISYDLSLVIILISFLIVTIAILLLWQRQLSIKNLYLYDVLNLLAPNLLAYLLLLYLIKTEDIFIGVILGVAVMDVFSFTKRGKNTLNAKLSTNIDTMARLSICLPIPGKLGLQQIIGVGDLLYYSVITMYYLHNFGISVGLKITLLIIIGQIVNIVSILLLRKIKTEQYKGFPATLFPGVFIIIVECLHII